MKYEWKKQESALYLPKQTPELISVPRQAFLIITGQGNPNNDAFAERVGVLYSLSYAIKMMPKQGYIPEGYIDYTVYPLEGLWDLRDEAKKSLTFHKDDLLYTIMIRQPEFVTQEVVNKALEIVKKKKPHPLLTNVTFGTIEDGLSVQMLHVGSYDSEPKSFELMNRFIEERNLVKRTMIHREIYLSDARKTEPAKLKTVLRYNLQ